MLIVAIKGRKKQRSVARADKSSVHVYFRLGPDRTDKQGTHRLVITCMWHDSKGTTREEVEDCSSAVSQFVCCFATFVKLLLGGADLST